MKPSEISKADIETYFGRYIKLAPEKELVESLISSQNLFLSVLESLSETQLEYRYEKEKWTIKEMLLHIIDNERIFVNRAVRFARNDKTILAGYDHNSYIKPANANTRSKESLINEYKTVRLSSISFFENLSNEILNNRGITGETSLSVAALGFVLAGHELHHLSVIKERYL